MQGAAAEYVVVPDYAVTIVPDDLSRIGNPAPNTQHPL
jgi:threonine dehydrogenase-like Zn-dependent dehydrogenase